eukprot:5645907-Prymnesium_polylepis.1
MRILAPHAAHAATRTHTPASRACGGRTAATHASGDLPWQHATSSVAVHGACECCSCALTCYPRSKCTAFCVPSVAHPLCASLYVRAVRPATSVAVHGACECCSCALTCYRRSKCTAFCVPSVALPLCASLYVIRNS